MKTCTICLETKSFSEFNTLNRSPDGLYPQCKTCKRAIDSEYYRIKKEKLKEKARKYYTENKEKILAKKDRIKAQEYNKNYRLKKKENIKVYNEEYRQKNAEAISLKRKEYRQKNKDKINEYNKFRLESNPNAKISKGLRNRLRDFLKLKGIKKTQKFESYVGCSIDQLKAHLESQFQDGMTWNNYGEWHIDHILPLSNARDEEQLYKLCHYLNLRPLWAKDNIKKNNKADICWQKLQRDRLIQEDMLRGMPFNLKAKDFILSEESFSPEHRQFIERYEWLGTVGYGVKHVFTARYNGNLAGVIMIGTPNSFSYDKNLECLIQRGACASWAPKNLNSRLVMFACRWMVDNTEKRIFTAYSDFDAGEIGTIYQACNFDYIGNNYGASYNYILDNGKKVTSRHFSRTSSVKSYCAEMGIKWEKEWSKENGYQDLSKIPTEIKDILKKKINEEMAKCKKIKLNKKGKYALLLTKGKEVIEKPWTPLPYPKRNKLINN